jgi:tRNA-Thr(GGU) m(6)t(6)A37 methyltransferase TsaA
VTDAHFVVKPIAVVHSTRADAVDDHWDEVQSSITLVEPYGPQTFTGLDQFSHLEVLFVFDRVDPDGPWAATRRPRNNPAWPEVGLFAQRNKDRPNRLGLSVCEIVEVDGATVVVRGLDAIDGTPVVDLKPYIIEFGPRGPLRQPSWSSELMADYF